MFAYVTEFPDSGSPFVCDRRSTTVPDYYTSQQLAQTLGIAEATITELQTKGLLQPTVKNGRSFFFSQQAHCLSAAVRWGAKDKKDFQKAFSGGEEPWLWPNEAPQQHRIWHRAEGATCSADVL